MEAGNADDLAHMRPRRGGCRRRAGPDEAQPFPVFQGGLDMPLRLMRIDAMAGEPDGMSSTGGPLPESARYPRPYR